MKSLTSTIKQEKQPSCVICHQQHQVFGCPELVKLNAKERVEMVKNHSLCFNCLRSNHSVKQCCSQSNCRKCGGRHNTLLHIEREASTETTALSNSVSNVGKQQVVLSTAVVKVKDHAGNSQSCRVLLDTGSQASFVSEACVQRLGLKRMKSSVSITGIGQTNTVQARGIVDLEIGSRVSDFHITLTALILPKITNYCQTITMQQRQQWAQLLNITPADTDYSPTVVDILLGADVFSELLCEGHLKGQESIPPAYNTHFGWVFSGKTMTEHTPSQYSVTVNHAFVQLEDQLKRFWEVEEVKGPVFQSLEEQRCEEHFQKTHKREDDGRYRVKLPINEEVPPLGESRTIAVRRLKHVERRLEQTTSRQRQYVEFMHEYLMEGHMQPVPVTEYGGSPPHVNYLAHHCVTKLDSSTTKLRVVFDASMKTDSGVSLNDRLLVGPPLQSDIWQILLRFRLHRIALVADIARMYRQILVSEKDMDLQRIVWRDKASDAIQEFRLCTVTYGTASAPYLAMRVLQQLFQDEGERWPVASKVASKDFYVDDIATGAETIHEALELQAQLIDLLLSGGFQLRKWMSNKSELVLSVPEEYREPSLHREFNNDSTVKMLGVRWSPQQDCFTFTVKIPDDQISITKRNMLSAISRLYDPMGWLSPIVIVAKVFIQQLWILGVEWDQEVPEPLRSQWSTYLKDFEDIKNIQIDRHVPCQSKLQIHAFCDASQQAYGAVIYLRASHQGNVSISLLCAKTRVAPVKQISVPRLELCATVLLARLLTSVVEALPFQVGSVYAWTDSMVCIQWIHSLPCRWKTFVANRVAEVQGIVSPDKWRHVPSEDNPADLASRGVRPNELCHRALWWHGPSWLKLEESAWPQCKYEGENHMVTMEQRTPTTSVAIVSLNKCELFNRYSSLDRLKRITAWCLRYVNNIRRKAEQRISGVLTGEELTQALHILIKCVQQEAFHQVILDLKAGSNKHHHVSSLHPFVDEQGILRVGGRLRNWKASFDQRHPILLPKNHPFTTLLIEYEHRRHLHAGAQLTQAAIQVKYWIVGMRDAVRQCIHRCVRCFRQRADGLKQLMGDLPSHRLEQVRPFQRCGVDLGGPFLVRPRKGRGVVPIKMYLAVFVCFVTKAVHLDFVSDLSSEAFLATFRRFVARRGWCSEIYSDNATNFVKTDKDIQNLLRTSFSDKSESCVSRWLADHSVSWHFIPPRSPHFGGLWEAAVKSAKGHLKRVVGATTLTLEEFITLIAEIEACLNSRPLVALSNDPHDFKPLTPGHFLIGASLSEVPSKDVSEVRDSCLQRWQLVQKMKQNFWKRWQREYIVQLQQRHKWQKSQRNLQENDLVLIKEENMPPTSWALGRVLNTYPGNDKLSRVALVKTQNGCCKRAITKLCLLPLEA